VGHQAALGASERAGCSPVALIFRVDVGTRSATTSSRMSPVSINFETAVATYRAACLQGEDYAPAGRASGREKLALEDKERARSNVIDCGLTLSLAPAL
jgi:hypothetical protein